MSKPRLSNTDYCSAAIQLGCEVAAIKAVAEQESLGAGFDAQDRPVILFERHIFHKLTDGVYDRSHPNISNANQGGYGRSREQYGRFSEAFALNPIAAMKSASWGKFQILGRNFKVCGFSNVNAFVDAMKESEGRQLNAFCAFVIGNGLDDELTSHNWAGFANGYNGHAYKKNHYDTKIAAGYARFSKEHINCGQISATAPTENPTTNQIDSGADDELTATNSATNLADVTPNEQPPTSDGAIPDSPANKTDVVIEKEPEVTDTKPKGILGALWQKVTGALGGGVTADVAIEKAQQAQALGLSERTWTFIFWAIIAGLVIWIVYHFVVLKILPWGKWLLARIRTNHLVTANGTADSVQVISADKIAEYEAKGYLVIKRA